jgi:hypothetical protein
MRIHAASIIDMGTDWNFKSPEQFAITRSDRSVKECPCLSVENQNEIVKPQYERPMPKAYGPLRP